MAEAFDPDKYLAEKSRSFDPDAYLAEKSGANQEGVLDRVSAMNPFTSKGRAEMQRRVAESKSDSEMVAARKAQSQKERDEVQAAIEGAGNFALLGYLPQLQAATRKGLKNVYEYYTGEKVPDKSYVEARDQNIARINKLAEENPKAYYGSGLGAALAQGAVTAPISGAAKLVGALPKAVSSVPVIGSAIKGGIYGLEAGLLANPGDEKGVVNPIQPAERIDKALEAARGGAVFGAGLDVAGRAAKSLPGIGKKALTVMFGPNKEQIDYYLKNSQDVNNAKSLPELKDKIDSIMSKLKSDVESGKVTVENSKKLISEVKNQIRDLNKESAFNFKIDQRDINDRLNRAKDELDRVYSGRVQSLKDIKAPTSLAEDVVQSTRDLKKKIEEGSDFAKEALNVEGKVKVFNAYKDLEDAASDLNIAGAGPATPHAQSAANEILKLKQTLSSIPTELSFRDAKKLIQQIDRSGKAIYNSPDFTDDVGIAYKKLRRAVDEQLKAANPEYAKRMKPVSEMMGLLEESAPRFGEKTSALSTLNRIGGATSEVERTNLKRLGELTGRDFNSPVEEYMSAQGQLKDPRKMAALRESLPEFQKVREIEEVAKAISDPRARESYIQSQLQKSGLLGSEETANRMLSEGEKGLLYAEEKMAPLRGVTEGTSESKIKSLLSAKAGEKIEIRKQMQELSKLSDTNFEKAIRDLQAKEAFSGGRAIGSRNTNLFAAIGAGIGTMVAGAPGAAVGGSSGAALGATIDKFGGAIAKKILDGVIKMGKNPSIQKINALDIPPEAKEYLTQSLIKYKAISK